MEEAEMIDIHANMVLSVQMRQARREMAEVLKGYDKVGSELDFVVQHGNRVRYGLFPYYGVELTCRGSSWHWLVEDIDLNRVEEGNTKDVKSCVAAVLEALKRMRACR